MTSATDRGPKTTRGATAQRIEQAAIDLFFREGYPKTSIRNITSALSLTPGAFYNHFSSKEELLYAIVSKAHRAIEKTLGEALERAGSDPTKQLREVTVALTFFYTEHQQEATVSKQEWYRLPDPQPAEMLSSERRIRKAVEGVLEKGLAEGVFRLKLVDGRQADIPVAAKAILDQIINAGVWFRRSGRLSVQQLAEQYAAMVLQMAGADMTTLREAIGS